LTSWVLTTSTSIFKIVALPGRCEVKKNIQLNVPYPPLFFIMDPLDKLVAAVSKYAFDRDQITDFVDDFYDVPTLWTNLEVDSDASLAALQILRLLEVGAGYRRRGGNSSLASLSGTYPVVATTDGAAFKAETATTTVTKALEPTPSSSFLAGSFMGSNIGHRLTATHLLMRTPEKYTVPITTLPREEDEREDNAVRVLSDIDSQG
jgi:hypothetical protein